MNPVKKIRSLAQKQPRNDSEWNEFLLFWIFFSVVIFALPALISSVRMAFVTGYYINLALYIFFYLCAVIVAFGKRIPYRLRAWGGVGIFFLLGILAMITLGPLGSARIYLFFSAIVAALILGARSGFLVLCGIYLVIFVFSWLMYHGRIQWNLVQVYDFQTWLIPVITFLLLCTVSTIAVSLLIRGLRQMRIRQEKSAREPAQVTRCDGGRQEYERFRASPDHYDLVMTDMTMPDMTGDELATLVLKLPIRGFAHKPLVKAEPALLIRKILDNPGTGLVEIADS